MRTFQLSPCANCSNFATIAADGTASGNGRSTDFDYTLAISGNLAGGGGGSLTLAAQGTAGTAIFTRSIDTADKLTGSWTIPGAGGGTFSGQRN